MDKKYVLGIDCGTSSVKVMIVDRDGVQAGFEKLELITLKPKEGYAEQDPVYVWDTIYNLIQNVLSNNNILAEQIAAIGIANQRETTIVWNKKTGVPYCNAVLWNDKRAKPLTEKAASEKMDAKVVERVGVYTIPNTSAMLLTWLLRNDSSVINGVKKGDAIYGTVNSWLLWKLTGGKVHCSDFANMSVTQLQDARKLAYDKEVLDYLRIPGQILPDLKSTGDIYGVTDEKLFSGSKIPIAGMLGDQMAATLGQGCINNGMVKVTYGTGCFCVMNSGKEYTPPAGGLFSIVLWTDENHPTYGMEGFFEIDSDRKDKVVLDGIVYQTANIIKSMEMLTGHEICILRVDGGMAKNDDFVQSLSDILGIPIERPVVSEATVLGAIYQAGLTIGFWKSLEETAALWRVGKRFEPKISVLEREALHSDRLNVLENKWPDRGISKMADDIELRMLEGIKLANLGFYSYTFEGKILAMDHVTFDFFQLEGIYENPQSVIGQNIESLFVYTGPKGRLRHELRARGRVSNLEYGIRTLKNSEKWGIHNSYVYFDKETGEEAIQVCFYEITASKLHEKKRIEQSEQRYKAIFEHSPDSIIILDMEDRIIECNKATIGLLELNFEKIIGQRFEQLEILDQAQAVKFVNLFQQLLNGEIINAVELEIVMKNGRSKWMELFPHLIFQSGKPSSIQIISRDITDRKLADIEMRKKLMIFELESGNIYLSKEPSPRQSIDAFNELLMAGNSGTLISRRSRKDYQNNIEYVFNHVKISEMDQGKHVLPQYNAIHGLLTGLPRGEVVHIDCIEYLMSRIGSKKTLNLIQYLKDLATSKNLYVLISVDPIAMSNVDMLLIEKESRNISPNKSLASLSSKLIDTLAYIYKLNKEGIMPSYSDIGDEFQLSKPTTRTRLKQLQELGTLNEIQKGRKKLLEITEKGKNYMGS